MDENLPAVISGTETSTPTVKKNLIVIFIKREWRISIMTHHHHHHSLHFHIVIVVAFVVL
jgi:uncharacterized protein YjlB